MKVDFVVREKNKINIFMKIIEVIQKWYLLFLSMYQSYFKRIKSKIRIYMYYL